MDVCDDTLYVVTGCYFDGTEGTTTDNGGNPCPVPTHYYKVLLRTKQAPRDNPYDVVARPERAPSQRRRYAADPGAIARKTRGGGVGPSVSSSRAVTARPAGGARRRGRPFHLLEAETGGDAFEACSNRARTKSKSSSGPTQTSRRAPSSASRRHTCVAAASSSMPMPMTSGLVVHFAVDHHERHVGGDQRRSAGRCGAAESGTCRRPAARREHGAPEGVGASRSAAAGDRSAIGRSNRS